ncbi:sugar fermentation stimulation protein [Clostridium sp. MCC353]|uniref:putative glycoside hydrolase n=1 Tax=Clostridium sp. MCC353 TaxID=2592646 RepID=UPI001C025AC6|nr:putative glycoside hydrolase [Clostridium sp. MCC353]MBT9778763.1 sugar fermentation stimulation protein [Clostridium sp. MCC353]
MKKRLLLAAMLLCLTGCARYEEVPLPSTAAETAEESVREEAAETEPPEETEVSVQPAQTDTRVPKKVKGIYLSAYIAGTPELMDNILAEIEKSQVNAVVIDVKNDDGRITFPIDTPVAGEIGACKSYISDVDGLIKKLKEQNIYVIARVVAFRDPFLAEAKPEWSLKKADGTLYRDNQGLAWVNPYKKEVWDYLIEVGKAAADAGFDEVQFDYIRFSTEKGMRQVVFDEEDTKGRSKTDIITEFITYAYEPLKEAGLFVSADVFGAIIGSEQDANSVGQIYYEMAKHLDYICPMIYPSHYADGNFGIEHPDTKPYDTVLAALMGSQADLASSSDAGKEEKLAVVRPWLQDFTASYLQNYIKYGPEQVKAQIRAVYDAGYEEWIFWDAACTYDWKGLEREN